MILTELGAKRKMSIDSRFNRQSEMRTRTILAVWLALALCFTAAGTAQTTSDSAREGPYERLIIRNAMVIPGHGGPAYGPADIIIEGNTIIQIISYNGVTGRPTGSAAPDAERIIDATGMYVMPGLIDLHTHIRSAELPLQYVYNLKLAHGVTTMVNGAGRGWENALEQQRLANDNKITAPRMYPIRDWGPGRSRDPGKCSVPESGRNSRSRPWLSTRTSAG